MKFCIVGVSNTLISYVLYIAALALIERASLSLRYDYLLASFVAFMLSVLWSFYWNNKFTFSGKREGKELAAALFKTYVSYSVTGLVLQNILLYVWVDMLGIGKAVAPLINLVITIPINFLMNKFWAFKDK